MDVPRYELKGYYKVYAMGYLHSGISCQVRLMNMEIKLGYSKETLADFFARLHAAIVMISYKDAMYKIKLATEFVDYQIYYLLDRYEESYLEKVLEDGYALVDAHEVMDLTLIETLLAHRRLKRFNEAEDNKRILKLLEKEERGEHSDISIYLKKR